MDTSLVPLVFRGEVLQDYFLDSDGNIYSTKGVSLRKLVIGNYRDEFNPYPKIGLRINGKSQTINVHRLVCETFHKKPTPEILTEEQWASLRSDVRNIILDYIEHADRWQVNHIDHDIKNFHPSNLEWVTASENQQKYQKHKRIL